MFLRRYVALGHTQGRVGARGWAAEHDPPERGTALAAELLGGPCGEAVRGGLAHHAKRSRGSGQSPEISCLEEWQRSD